MPPSSILDRIGNTPLIRLNHVAAGCPVPVLGKCEFLNPGGSVKDHDAGYAVEGIGGSVPPAVLDLSVIDAAERVSDDESFAMTGRLIREEGLLVGGSSGTAVAAAMRVASAGTVRGPVIVLLADSWDRYLSRPWMDPLKMTPPVGVSS